MFRQERYKAAREHWASSVHLEADLFDSPLQEATHLLRELAISLEGAKDDKRLRVVEQVLHLLSQPDVNGTQLNAETAAKINDASMREWLHLDIVSTDLSESTAAKLAKLESEMAPDVPKVVKQIT